jgi:glycogen debranching enzyme
MAGNESENSTRKITKKLTSRPAALVGKLAGAKDATTKQPILSRIPSKWTSPNLALRTVTSKNGLGVYASSDKLFRGAVFGRDSLEVAEDLMNVRPRLVGKIILTLASLQGEVQNHTTEEEPGKIIHEYRTSHVEGKPLNPVSQEIFDRLSARWGGTADELAYFGSIDATPHYVRVLADYTQQHGLNFFNHVVTLRSGHEISMLDSLENSMYWLSEHLQNSKSGLVEYLRKNPHGIENQVWKDSVEFYVHENGELANHTQPIASIEVQSLAYDAFITAGELLPSRAAEWQKQAEKLRERTLHLLWDEERQYFSLGTDFDQNGRLRIIKTKAANPAALLDSHFFDTLPEQDSIKYISSIVADIMSEDFLTDAGIRSRALSAGHLIKFWDYHGSYVSWPKETYDIAKGLRRQGFGKLATELENRLVNVVKAMRAYPEFFYVDARGRVLGMSQSSHGHGEIIFVESTNHPERIQAWTVSAILAITSTINQQRKRHTRGWQENLERDIIRQIPHMPFIKSPKELAVRYPAYPYQLK